MITDIWFQNSYGDYRKFNMFDPRASGYAITDITGLSPTDVDLKTTQLASGNKFVYNKGFRKIRDIEISLRYMDYNRDGYSIQVLRENILSLLKPNDFVKMAIITDKPMIYYTEGYVSSHVADIFSQECGSKIKIQCPDIFLYEGESYNGETGYRKKEFVDDFAVSSTAGQRTHNKTIAYDGTFRSDICVFIGNNPATEGLNDLGGTFEISVVNNGKTRNFKVSIPYSEGSGQSYRRFIADFTSDIPRFTIYKAGGTTLDGSKYVGYKELVAQDELPSISYGRNTFTFAFTPNDGQSVDYYSNELKYYNRYLGV